MIPAYEFLKNKAPEDPRFAVVTGGEEFLRAEVIEKWSKKLPKDIETRRFDGTDQNRPVALADVFDELRTRELFGGDKLVHVHLADAFVKEHTKRFVQFLEDGEAVQALLIEGEKLLARGRKAKVSGVLAAIEKLGGVVVQCDPLYDTNFGGRGPEHDSPLSRWVVQRAKGRHKKTIDMRTAWLLHRLVGNNLRELDAELGKLALSLGENEEIRAEDVRDQVSSGRLAPVFGLVDTVFSRRAEDALQMGAILFERGVEDASGKLTRDAGGIAMMFLGSFCSRLRSVGRAIEMLAQGQAFDDAARAVGQAGPFKNQFRNTVDAMREPGVIQRVTHATRLFERDLKSGAGAPRLLFEMFVHDALDTGRRRGVV